MPGTHCRYYWQKDGLQEYQQFCHLAHFKFLEMSSCKKLVILPSHELSFAPGRRGAALVTYRFHTLPRVGRHKHPQIGTPQQPRRGTAAAHCCRSCWLLSHQGHSWWHRGRNAASSLGHLGDRCSLLDYSPHLGKSFLQPCQRDLNTKHTVHTKMKTGPKFLVST